MKKAVDETTDDLDKFKSQANDKFQNIDDQLSNMQNDLNGNKQKIEDANVVIKRHTEQLIELEPEINDLKHEMSELERVNGKSIPLTLNTKDQKCYVFIGTSFATYLF